MNDDEIMVIEAGARDDAPPLLRLVAGAGAVVTSVRPEVPGGLLDALTGLAPAAPGRLRLFGQPVAAQPERVLLERLAGLGHAAGGPVLLSNLKVWENLLLPLRGRRGKAEPDMAALEKQVLEAFAAGGFGESWVQRALADAPDRLDEFERIACSLVRCHLRGFRLLVCDRIFEGHAPARLERLAAMVNWLGTRHPGSAVLVLHLGEAAAADRRFGLSGWAPFATLALETEPWRAS